MPGTRAAAASDVASELLLMSQPEAASEVVGFVWVGEPCEEVTTVAVESFDHERADGLVDPLFADLDPRRKAPRPGREFDDLRAQDLASP